MHNAPEDNHLHALKVDLHTCRGGHTRSEAIRGELTRIVNNEVWVSKVGKFVRGWSDEHVVHEQRMVRAGTNNADFDAILGVPLKGEIISEVATLACRSILTPAKPSKI